jgi:hypothetical protein
MFRKIISHSKSDRFLKPVRFSEIIYLKNYSKASVGCVLRALFPLLIYTILKGAWDAPLVTYGLTSHTSQKSLVLAVSGSKALSQPAHVGWSHAQPPPYGSAGKDYIILFDSNAKFFLNPSTGIDGIRGLGCGFY